MYIDCGYSVITVTNRFCSHTLIRFFLSQRPAFISASSAEQVKRTYFPELQRILFEHVHKKYLYLLLIYSVSKFHAGIKNVSHFQHFSNLLLIS